MKELWKQLSGWGNYPTIKAQLIVPGTTAELQQAIRQNKAVLARGNGNSYGDSGLHETIISTKCLNKILPESQGKIEVEAGVTLQNLLAYLVPKGWFLPVTPGTKLVTIGGAIASDVHGKNHRKEGSFFNITESLKLVDESGDIVYCNRLENAKLFYSCFGGMGLKGIIVSAVIRLMPLPSEMITERQYIAQSLPEIFSLMQQHKEASYLVSWIDLLNKKITAVVKTGEWNKQAKAKQRNRTFTIPFLFPITPPKFLFRWYNKQYLAKAKKQLSHIIHYNQFFYPLDSIKNWRYIFGKKGLLQYHFSLPLDVAEAGITEAINLVKNSGVVCTLAVLKLFGKGNEETPNSFAKEGYNLALDFIHTKDATDLIYQLDKKISALGGQIYKAKDAVSNLPLPLTGTKFQSMQNQRYEHQQKR